MNKKNRHKSYSKGYYEDHACNEDFKCKKCGLLMVPTSAGTSHRNHCSNCLYSLHVDNKPGDRSSNCHRIMEPVAIWAREDGEWAIIHRCQHCGKYSSNRVAADDNPLKLVSIAMKPLASPPFPLEYIEAMVRVTGNNE